MKVYNVQMKVNHFCGNTWKHPTVHFSICIILLIFRVDCFTGNDDDTDCIHVQPKQYDEKEGRSWDPSYDVLSEVAAFRTLPPVDQNRTLSLEQSSVTLVGNPTSFYVGEMIKIRVVLRDQNGRKRCRGGDNIRVRMFDESRDAYTAGYVTDHNNGKYTVVLRSLWGGNATIEIDVVYTVEEIAYLYRLRRLYPTLRVISAIFVSEITPCNLDKRKLDRTVGSCDLTERNGNEPWFCQAPKNQKLGCDNFTDLVRSMYSMRNLYEMKKSLSLNQLKPLGSLDKRQKTKLGDQIAVHIKDSDVSGKLVILPNCTSYDRRLLWKQRSPTGYFYNNKWIVPHCQGIDLSEFRRPKCLRSKIIYFYGDSTMKQWFENMKKRLSCANVGGLLFEEQRCRNPNMNLTLRYIRHNLPGNVRKNGMDTRKFEDVGDQITDGQSEIFVIHIYSHYTYYHQNFYRERIKSLRKSIKILLDMKPKATIIIKGPATISKRRDFAIVDYFSVVYRQILFEELDDFHDKIIYLDNSDMTIGRAEPNIHVPTDLVTEMINTMIKYVCSEG